MSKQLTDDTGRVVTYPKTWRHPLKKAEDICDEQIAVAGRLASVNGGCGGYILPVGKQVR